MVSHSAQDNILRDYGVHFGMEPDCIFGWELGPERRKPSPYPIDEILSRYGVSPRELLVVDDMKSGYDMAKTRGVDFAWAGWSRQTVPEVAEFMSQYSDFSFDSPAALERFLFAP